MFSVITNIYNKKTKGPTLMEFFTAKGKLFSLSLSPTRDVRCVHHRWYGTLFKLLPHTRQHVDACVALNISSWGGSLSFAVKKSIKVGPLVFLL